MPAETSEHVKLKEIMSQKLDEWFGVSLPEYQSSGMNWMFFLFQQME